MGIPDGAHTHGSGGSGLGPVVLVLLAVALLGPAVTAAAAELLHLVLIVAGVIVGVAVLGVGGLLAWRWRRPRLDAARTTPPLLHQKVVRAAPPLPKARQLPEIPAAPGRELPGALHLHFHGVQAEDVAAIIERHRNDG
jgi:hypothetical protein